VIRCIHGTHSAPPIPPTQSLGDAVIAGRKLVRLAQTPNQRYSCTFERGNTTIEVITDFVVLAIPFAVLASHPDNDALVLAARPSSRSPS
jgi:hypothetical protein